MTTTVLVVDDQPMVRAGLTMLLNAEGDLEVIGEAESGTEALQLARQLNPDVVLMDVRMPGMDGVTATQQLVQESQNNPNRLIKVPATDAGLDALEELAAAGINLNVTLIFSDRQYQIARENIWRGAQRRKSLDNFKSVYSIFVSRVDVYTEKHVPTLSPAAQGMVGIAGALSAFFVAVAGGFYALWFGDLDRMLEPFARIAYVNLDANSFQERGGPAALRSPKDNQGTAYTTVGLHAAKTFSSADRMTTTFRGTLGWRHAFGDRTPLSTFAFAGSSSFATAGVPIAGDAIVISGGLDVNIIKAATLGIYYNGQVLHHIVDNGVRANLSWKF